MTSEANAKHFPNDSLWQKHCEMLTAYRNAIPPITSKPGWDGRAPHSTALSRLVDELENVKVEGQLQ